MVGGWAGIGPTLLGCGVKDSILWKRRVRKSHPFRFCYNNSDIKRSPNSGNAVLKSIH